MRYKLTLEYDGTSYCGWQRQFGIAQKSVEEVLRNAAHSMFGCDVDIAVCGRTDAGVHATGQVVHFDLEKKFDPYRIIMGLNNYLRGEDVCVLACEIVDENFHARFSTKMRHYRYKIINRRAPLALEKNRAWRVAPKLDVKKMQIAAKFLLGEHDFTSFRDAECQASSPIRTISKIEILQKDDEILIEISAKSFLHHMVRNITGTLVFIGLGKIAPEEMQKILAAKDRTKSGPNAPSCGLYFLRVDY